MKLLKKYWQKFVRLPLIWQSAIVQMLILAPLTYITHVSWPLVVSVLAHFAFFFVYGLIYKAFIVEVVCVRWLKKCQKKQ